MITIVILLQPTFGISSATLFLYMLISAFTFGKHIWAPPFTQLLTISLLGTRSHMRARPYIPLLETIAIGTTEYHKTRRSITRQICNSNVSLYSLSYDSVAAILSLTNQQLTINLLYLPLTPMPLFYLLST